MIEGRYRVEPKGEKPSPWFYNMITDKGYDFWTKGDATLSGNYVKSILVGSNPDNIQNLNPESSITALQSSSEEIKVYNISTYTAELKKSENSAVLTHKFKVTSTDRFQVLSEIGLSLDNEIKTLATYSIFKSTEGLDVIPTMVEDKFPYSSPLIYELNIRIPFISKNYETILMNNEEETSYKVTVNLLDSLAAASDLDYSLKNPFKFTARMLGLEGEGDISATQVRLSSYNKVSKEAVYNIVFNFDGAWINKPEKYNTIYIKSSLGDYSLTLTDPETELNNGFPETSSKDLVIPFKVLL